MTKADVIEADVIETERLIPPPWRNADRAPYDRDFNHPLRSHVVYALARADWPGAGVSPG